MKKAILILLLLPIIASAQSFNVFDIDTSEYPIMKAKFYSIDENGEQILNHTTSDFEITENGNPAEVLSVSCPEPNSEPVSYVIAVDVSGSMSGEEIVTLKNSLEYFIDLVPSDGSEVAIIAFNSKNHYISDFTKNKEKLKSSVNTLSVSGGTDFDAAFIDPVAGALVAMEKAKHTNRNVIIITDGYATGNEDEIISKAKSLGVRIFGIMISNQTPTLLRNIFSRTEGRSFENIITEDDYQNTFLILNQLIGNEPCEINWNSNLTCEGILAIELTNRTLGVKTSLTQYLNSYQYLSIAIDNYFIDFGTYSTDTTITITAKNGTQTINDIIFEPDNSYYEIITPLPVTIHSKDSVEIELKYAAVDDSREYSRMDILGDYCNTSMGLLKGDKNKSLTQKTLNLTHPNGGEKFIAGVDTIITWEGVSDKEKININFSSDNGLSWTNVDSLGFDLQKNWSVPNLKSDECLIKLDYETKENNNRILWENKNSSHEGSFIYDMTIANDFNILTTGITRKDERNNDLAIRKIDLDGNTIWEKYYGSIGKEGGYGIAVSQKGGFVVCGGTNSTDSLLENSEASSYYSRGWILKLDMYGEIEWHYHDFPWSNNSLSNVLVTSNNKIIVSRWDYYVAQMSELGELEWEHDNSELMESGPKSIIELTNGDIVTVGNSPENTNDEPDYYIVKYNSLGGVIYNKIQGGNYSDVVNDAIATDDNGFIILLTSNSNSNDYESNRGEDDIWLLKYKASGVLEWMRNFGGTENERGFSIAKTNNGNFLINAKSGIDNPDVIGYQETKGNWFFEIDNMGNIQSQTLLPFFVNTVPGKAVMSINDNIVFYSNGFKDTSFVLKIASDLPPLQSDTSDAVFSIIMPEPVIQNNDIDMGEMIVGNTKDTIVSSVICNTGDAPLHVLGVDITGGDDIDFLIPRGAGDFYLEKDECQDMMFEFTPSQLGNRTAVATIRTTIGDFTDTINIRGVGINPIIEATTDVVDFGQFELGDSKDTNVVLIKNVGADDITITETKITGPDLEQFDMVPLPSFTLASGDDKELELNYTAKYGGRTSSIIEFHYDGVGSPLRSMLFAEGIGGEVYPQVPDAYVGDRVELGLHLGRIKPEGLDEVATNFTATVSYNSTLLAPIDKNMTVTTENTTSFIEIEGQLSGVSQIATVPMKVGLGTAVKSGLVVTEFQLYDANGDSVDYEIEPGVGEFNVLGICEEGGTRLVNPNSEKVGLRVAQNRQITSATIYLDLIESGQTDLIIYDQLGNGIETAYSGIPSTGTKELRLDLSNYTNGRYYIKLTTPTITKTEIIEIVR